MTSADYLKNRPAPKGAEARRQALSDERNVKRLEGYLGPMDLGTEQWDHVVGRLRSAGARDWRRLRVPGELTVPPAPKKTSKKKE